MPVEGYGLGCPEWGRKDWLERFFSSRAGSLLEQYASVFNAVEGNTTFYGQPKPDVVSRWGQSVPSGFRFCFKLPRTMTHERGLGSGRLLSGFLRVLEPISDRLGPVLIQFPASFGPGQLPGFARWVEGLSRAFVWSVELRHPAFYNKSDAAARMGDCLHHHGLNRVVFDSRALFQSPAVDPDSLHARARKPNLFAGDEHLHWLDSSSEPIIRFIGDPTPDNNLEVLSWWAQQVSRWLEQGKRPYFFAHAPNDHHAPEVARLFHHCLSQCRTLARFPSWPATGDRAPVQGELFS